MIISLIDSWIKVSEFFSIWGWETNVISVLDKGHWYTHFPAWLKLCTYVTVGKTAVGLLNAAALPNSASLCTGDPGVFHKNQSNFSPAFAKASRLLLQRCTNVCA